MHKSSSSSLSLSSFLIGLLIVIVVNMLNIDHFCLFVDAKATTSPPTVSTTTTTASNAIDTTTANDNVVKNDENKDAHPHNGKVTPFAPGDPKVELNEKALDILSRGEPFTTQIQSGTSGRGLVVQDVDAHVSIVWERILDYNHYAKMVPKTISSENYKVIQHDDDNDRQTIFTRMVVGFPMLKLAFYIKHEYYPQLNSLTWTLDYTKKSDLDDSCGYWYVIPHPDSPHDRTRVYYSVEIGMFDWVPKFVVRFMSQKALTDATAWVKKESELQWKRTNPNDKQKLMKTTGNENEMNKNVVETNNEQSSQKDKVPEWLQWLIPQEEEEKDTESKHDKVPGWLRWLIPPEEEEKQQEEKALVLVDENNDSNENNNNGNDKDDDTASCSTESDDDDESCDNNVAVMVKEPVGVRRYALITTTIVLFLYNIHLFFSL